MVRDVRRQSMATERHWICSTCDSREWAGRLFDVLREVSAGAQSPCATCGAVRTLELVLPFGVGAGPHRGKVLDVFLPEDIRSWRDEKNNLVEYFPFLVMVESLAEGYVSAWMPYWHLVTDGGGRIERKYGQWAPFMDLESFANLVLKARTKGYSELSSNPTPNTDARKSGARRLA